MPLPLSGRIALITGASRGIGAAVAKRLAAEGAQAILAARTVGGLEEVDDAIKAAGGQATLCPLDLKDHDKIDALAASVAERFGRLDILVGNAAMLGMLMPVAHAKPEMWRNVMDVNCLANWRLLRAFDPLLRASGAGRAIFVTSGITQGIFPYWGAYAASKAALETLVKTYAAEVAGTTAIRANLIDPGAVRTRMRADAFPGENPDTLPVPEQITDLFLRLAQADYTETGQILRYRNA